MKRAIWLVGIVLSLSSVAWADTLVLKGGMKLEGEIVSETDTVVILKLKAGGRTTIQKKQIEKIVRSEPGEAKQAPKAKKDPAPRGEREPPAAVGQIGTRRFHAAIMATRKELEAVPASRDRIMMRLRKAAQTLAEDYKTKAIGLEKFEIGFAILTVNAIDGLDAVEDKPPVAVQRQWFAVSLGPIDEAKIFTEAEWKEVEPRIKKRTGSLIQARAAQRMKRDGNETRAKGTLLTVRTAQALHKAKHGRYASKLAELGKLIDPALARSGTKAGYRFELVASEAGWLLVASPVRPKVSGALFFAANGKSSYEADRPVFSARLPFQVPAGARKLE